MRNIKGLKKYIITSISFPIAILLLIVLMTSGGGKYEGQTPINKDVLKWGDAVEKYAKMHEIPEYTELILAVMQQESGGRHVDLMQSSECSYNTKYSKNPNSIDDPEYSIDCGVQALRDAIKGAEVTGPDDMENIKLALQSYNFGPGFIDYAKKRGGYSKEVAKEFSIYMVNQSRTSAEPIEKYGDINYVDNVLQFYIRYGEKSDNEIANKAVEIALKQKGKEYVWGAMGPDTFDCSGLVAYCYNEAGFKHDRTTADEYAKMCEEVKEVQVGDLIFFRKPNESTIHHIGIYLGPNLMVHAPYTGEVVKEASYNWRNEIITYGRLKMNKEVQTNE